MSQPTLLSIPGILFRTTMRLIARIVMFLAGIVLLIGAMLALSSLLLATWRTPRTRRTQLIVDAVLLATQIVKEFRQ
jgi:hypothetical protein